ncbi:MAG: ABC transporter permease [Acidobacteria bacterium]|nr:ABC transporter permease [Acidobacteriota bacterium]
MRTLVLLWAMTKREAIELRRYAFDTVMQLVTIYVVFLLIFFGAKAFIGGAARTGGTLPGIVVGFMMWTLAISAYSDVSFTLVQEATAGTLEQIAMAPLGLPRVLVARFLAGLGFNLVIQLALLLLMMATTGQWLHLDLLSILPLMAVTVAGVFGIGLAVGGLALVFKRVQSVMQILQFAFVALVALPLDRFPFFKYLPLAWGNHLIGRVMIDGISIVRIPGPDLALLLAVSVAWAGLGLAFMSRLDRVARSRALLGHY